MESKPEHVTRKVMHRLFQIYREEGFEANEDGATTADYAEFFTETEYHADLDIDRTARFFAWAGILRWRAGRVLRPAPLSVPAQDATAAATVTVAVADAEERPWSRRRCHHHRISHRSPGCDPAAVAGGHAREEHGKNSRIDARNSLRH